MMLLGIPSSQHCSLSSGSCPGTAFTASPWRCRHLGIPIQLGFKGRRVLRSHLQWLLCPVPLVKSLLYLNFIIRGWLIPICSSRA